MGAAWMTQRLPVCLLWPPAGTHFKLEEVKEAILETQVPKRGGKCFLEG